MVLQPDIESLGRAERLPSIDLLRGLVIVLMALDHARDYYGFASFDPLDLERTTPLWFMTRWVTHFCAPVFVFLAGTGAYLWGSRGRTRREVSVFMLTRGMWLVFLELTFVRWGWFVQQLGDLDYSFFLVQVIWALGWSMIVLAGLVFLPVPVIAGVGIALIAGHNALDGVRAENLGRFAGLWHILHIQGAFPYRRGGQMFVQYPLIPWPGVMATGYALGRVMLLPRAARRRACGGLGIALVLAFVALRLVNRYGDPSAWTHQDSALFTVFSFVDATKYPPSLDYLLMTLGPALLLLAGIDGLPRGAINALPARFLVTFGRVPLFFYVLHLYLLQLGSFAYLYARYGDRVWDFAPGNLPDDVYIGPAPVFIAWVCVIAALYPVCRWFSAVKRRRRDWWLTYL